MTTVSVTVNANYVTVKKDAITLTEGESYKLADLFDKSSKDVKWSIKGDAAKIEDGSVVAVAAGTATLTVTCEEVSVNVEVTVEAAVTPVDDLVMYPAQMQSGGWGIDVTAADENAVDFAATGTYKVFFYNLAETIDAASYEKVVFKMKSSANISAQLMATDAALDDWGNPIAFVSKTCNSADVVEVEIPLDLYAGKQINRIAFANQGDQPTGTVYSITFVGRENGPIDAVVYPEDGTLTTPSPWEVALFNSVNFKELAGKTVKITLEAMRVGGTVSPKVNASFTTDYGTGIHWGKEIGTEWTDFGADAFVVPESWTEGESYYYGLRTIDGQDYSKSLFFYRNFSVTVVE